MMMRSRCGYHQMTFYGFSSTHSLFTQINLRVFICSKFYSPRGALFWAQFALGTHSTTTLRIHQANCSIFMDGNLNKIQSRTSVFCVSKFNTQFQIWLCLLIRHYDNPRVSMVTSCDRGCSENNR